MVVRTFLRRDTPFYIEDFHQVMDLVTANTPALTFGFFPQLDLAVDTLVVHPQLEQFVGSIGIVEFSLGGAESALKVAVVGCR